MDLSRRQQDMMSAWCLALAVSEPSQLSPAAEQAASMTEQQKLIRGRTGFHCLLIVSFRMSNGKSCFYLFNWDGVI